MWLCTQDNDTYSFTIYGHPGIRSDWNDVILSPIPSGKPTQKMTYLIRGLEPSSQYEARVEAKNRFGWSRSSDSFTFSTTGMGESKCSVGSSQLVSHPQLMSLHALRKCYCENDPVSILRNPEVWNLIYNKATPCRYTSTYVGDFEPLLG
jgi:hypothetical protein